MPIAADFHPRTVSICSATRLQSLRSYKRMENHQDDPENSPSKPTHGFSITSIRPETGWKDGFSRLMKALSCSEEFKICLNCCKDFGENLKTVRRISLTRQLLNTNTQSLTWKLDKWRRHCKDSASRVFQSMWRRFLQYHLDWMALGFGWRPLIVPGTLLSRGPLRAPFWVFKNILRSSIGCKARIWAYNLPSFSLMSSLYTARVLLIDLKRIIFRYHVALSSRNGLAFSKSLKLLQKMSNGTIATLKDSVSIIWINISIWKKTHWVVSAIKFMKDHASMYASDIACLLVP